jgi:hypothetical protein
MPQRPALAPERPIVNPEGPLGKRGELLSLPSSLGIAVKSLDRSFCFYRIRGGRLERIQDHECEWTELSPPDILQHLVLRTPVATWLEDRIVLTPAEWVKPYLHIG